MGAGVADECVCFFVGFAFVGDGGVEGGCEVEECEFGVSSGVGLFFPAGAGPVEEAAAVDVVADVVVEEVGEGADESEFGPVGDDGAVTADGGFLGDRDCCFGCLLPHCRHLCLLPYRCGWRCGWCRVAGGENVGEFHGDGCFLTKSCGCEGACGGGVVACMVEQ